MIVPVTAVGSTGASPRTASGEARRGEGRRGGRAKVLDGRTQRAVIAKRDRMIAGKGLVNLRQSCVLITNDCSGNE